jgi:tetratricopeptide (TPR) repeat protein
MKNLFFFVIALFSFVIVHAQTPTLTLNQPISRKCELGDKFSYEIKANADDFIHILIRQNAINVTTSLFSPTGKQLIKSESPLSVYETEWLSWKFDSTGTYRIEIEGKRSAGNGVFEIELVEQRKYTEADQKRLLAQENFLLGAVSLETFDYPKAIESTKTALKQYQELGRDAEIALCFSNLAKNDYQNGNNSQSIQYFENAIEFYKKANDLSSESLILFLIAKLYVRIGNLEKSLEYDNKALAANKQIGDKNRIAFSTLEIGRYYEQTSNPDKAIEVYEDTCKVKAKR